MSQFSTHLYEDRAGGCCRYADLHSLEDTLAVELKRRKQEEVAREHLAQKLYLQSEELEALRCKISQGYVNKERSRQLA